MRTTKNRPMGKGQQKVKREGKLDNPHEHYTKEPHKKLPEEIKK